MGFNTYKLNFKLYICVTQEFEIWSNLTNKLKPTLTNLEQSQAQTEKFQNPQITSRSQISISEGMNVMSYHFAAMFAVWKSTDMCVLLSTSLKRTIGFLYTPFHHLHTSDLKKMLN